MFIANKVSYLDKQQSRGSEMMGNAHRNMDKETKKINKTKLCYTKKKKKKMEVQK